MAKSEPGTSKSVPVQVHFTTPAGPASSVRSLTNKISHLEAKVSNLESELQLLKKLLQKSPGSVLDLKFLKELIRQVNHEDGKRAGAKSAASPTYVTRFSTIANPIICKESPVPEVQSKKATLGPRSTRNRGYFSGTSTRGGGSSSSSKETTLDRGSRRTASQSKQPTVKEELITFDIEDSDREDGGAAGFDDGDDDYQPPEDIEPVQTSPRKRAFGTESESEEQKIIKKQKVVPVPEDKRCESCGKSFENEYNYKRHMKSHSGFKPFKCPICRSLFTQTYHVVRHVQNVHKYKEFTSDMVERIDSPNEDVDDDEDEMNS